MVAVLSTTSRTDVERLFLFISILITFLLDASRHLSLPSYLTDTHAFTLSTTNYPTDSHALPRRSLLCWSPRFRSVR